eukprot:2562388-Ditylum_brightwellii.AAC.1
MDTLYAQNKNGSYSIYNRVLGHMYAYAPTKTDTNTLPQSALFTPVKDVGETIICTQIIDSFVSIVQENSLDHDYFKSYLHSLDPCPQRLLGNLLSQEVDVNYWVAALQSGIVETASDGS